MKDYTGPHDYFDENYVRWWDQAADSRRPFRIEFFNALAVEINEIHKPKILDIGSGPGFLARHIISNCDVDSYHLFDFSPHMLELSRTRLAPFAGRVSFHEGSFLDEGWWESLPGPFDAIVSMQAVHEVCDAARIPRLYSEMGRLLADNGLLLIADQVNVDGKKEEHFLTEQEQRAAFIDAGYKEVRRVYAAGDMMMFRASKLAGGGALSD